MSNSPKCPHADGCALYGRFSMKSALRIWQVSYCDNPAQYEQCARYTQSLAGMTVPATLLPNGKSLST